MDIVGPDGDLSSDENGNNRKQNQRSNSFLESGGHRVTRLNRERRKNKIKKQKLKGCKC